MNGSDDVLAVGDENAFCTRSLVHRGAKAWILATLMPDGRAFLMTQIHCPERRPHSEFWTVAGMSLHEAVAQGEREARRLLDHLELCRSLSRRFEEA